MEKYRKFNGKRGKLVRSTDNPHEARHLKELIKDKGLNVRIIKEKVDVGTEYNVYKL